MAGMTGDDRMTPAQAAEELGITTRAVQDRLKRGLMRGTNYGGRVWLIDRTEVERMKQTGPLKRGPKPKRKPEE
jgi:excisionase family DNA binding protein